MPTCRMANGIPTILWGPDYGPRLMWENFALLMALQASIGCIGPDVRGIAVEARPDRIVIHACLRRRSERALEDLADLTSDLETDLTGTTDPPVEVQLVTEVGDTDQSWSGYQYRRLYLEPHPR